MSWRDLPLTHAALTSVGLRVVSFWTPDPVGETPSTVYVRWQQPPLDHQRHLAEQHVFARTIHHLRLSETPEGAPWA